MFHIAIACSLSLAAALSAGCTHENLVDASALPSSENAVFTTDGRLFVAGGNNVYEILEQPDGDTEALVIATADCELTGMAARATVLYAACTTIVEVPAGEDTALVPVDAALMRIEPGPDPGATAQVESTPFFTPTFWPNGMAFDDLGRLYVSNSYSALAPIFGLPGGPAIVRVSIGTGELTITETPWLDADAGGFFPNGVQHLRGDLLLATANQLSAIPIEADGSAGMPQLLHRTDETRVLDDFAVLPGGYLAIAELTNPLPGLRDLLFPDAPPVTSYESMITFVGTRGHHDGQVVHRAHLDPAELLPSSVAWSPVSPLGADALVVTDYFGGGIDSLRAP